MESNKARRKNPQSKIDRALNKMSDAENQEFRQMIRSNTNYQFLERWFENLGYKISQQNLSDWWRKNRPLGAEARMVNALTETYLGIDSEKLLHMGAAIAAKSLNLIEESLTESPLSGMSEEVRAQTMVQLLKELRQTSTVIKEAETNQSQKALILLGAQYVETELLETFKDSPFLEALATAIAGVFDQIESKF